MGRVYGLRTGDRPTAFLNPDNLEHPPRTSAECWKTYFVRQREAHRMDRAFELLTIEDKSPHS